MTLHAILTVALITLHFINCVQKDFQGKYISGHNKTLQVHLSSYTMKIRLWMVASALLFVFWHDVPLLVKIGLALLILEDGRSHMEGRSDLSVV